MMVKGSMHQEDTKIITYATNIRDLRYRKQTSTKLRREIHRSKIIVRDSNTPLSIKNNQAKDQ